MKLSARIWLLVSLTWAMGAIGAGILMYRARVVCLQYDRLFDRELHLQDSARQMQVRFKTQVQDWKDILLRGSDPASLSKYTQGFHEEESAVRSLADTLQRNAADPESRDLAQQFDAAHRALGVKYAAAYDAFVQSKGIDFKTSDTMVKGQDRPPVTLVDKIVDLSEKRIATERSAQLTAASHEFQAIGALLLLAFGAIAAGAFVTIRSLSRTLRRSITELETSAQFVSGASQEIAASVQSMSQSSTEQAAALEETSAAGEEVNSMARRNSENSRLALAMVQEAQAKFDKTRQSLDQMIHAMNEIHLQSGKISGIIKSIDEIAFQTNILALNAAVEAARAGEAGLGFAVVADEVRALAQRSAQAAHDTASLIEESLSKSNGGTAKVGQVATLVQSAVEQSGRIKSLVDEVNAGSHEQERGIDQIAAAVTQMQQVVQAFANGAGKSAVAADQLRSQSLALHGVAARLGAMV